MLKRPFFFIFLLVLSFQVSASCWVVNNLNGSSAYQYNNYSNTPDGFKDRTFVVNINKDKPSFTDSLEKYTVIDDKTMVGIYSTDLGTTIDVIQISGDNKRLLMTRNRTNSTMKDMVASYVGDIVRQCDQ